MVATSYIDYLYSKKSGIMKNIIATIFVVFTISIFSQNHLYSILKYDTAITYLHMPADDLDEYKISLDKDKIWFFKYNASYIKTNEFKLYCFHINTLQTDSFLVKIPRLHTLLNKNYHDNFSVFSVYNDFILLGYDCNLFVLKRNKKNFKVYKKYKLNSELYPESAFFISEDKIVLVRNYNFSIDPGIKYNTLIATYSVKNKEVIESILPFFPFIASTTCSYGGGFFSTNTQKTCISFHQRTNFHISVYDTNLLLQEEIQLNPPYWNQLPDKQIQLIDSNEQAYINISKVYPLLKKYSFLDHIHWIDSAKILIKYYNQDTCYYDVVEKQNNKWVITVAQLQINYPDKHEVITKEKHWIIGNYLDKVFICDDKMICIYTSPNINPNGMSIKEYQVNEENSLKNGSNYFSIGIFNLNLP